MNLRPRKRTTPIIPIVALVDILVIVLLFIVATTTFKQTKTQMDINLPQSSMLGSSSTEKEIRKTLAVTAEQKILLDGAEINTEYLPLALKQMKAAHPAAKLELQADQTTSLGLLVKIWDALKTAGYPINDVPARIQRAAAGS